MALDWISHLAKDLAENSYLSEDVIKQTIIEHALYLNDVALMPVPRCDQCRHWDKTPHVDVGFCNRMLESDTKACACSESHDCVLVAPSFGCVQWEAK